MTRLALAPLAVALGLAACSEAPRPPDPRLWTIADLQSQSALAGAAVAGDAGLPGGIPLAQVLASDGHTLVVRDTLDVYQAAYVTTEVWAHYDRVWVQPMYVLITGWDANGPVPLRVDGEVKPIFSVGPRSGFYSPFWQTIYVDLSKDPEAAPALTSVRSIVDSGHALVAGPGRTVSLVPPMTTVDPDGTTTTKELGVPRSGQGWLDGSEVAFLDFGTGSFTWDQTDVVLESPLYHFVFPGTNGELVALDVPSVAAPGVPGASAPSPSSGAPARYASYWRLYTVQVPTTARVFAPPGQTEIYRPGLVAALAASGFPEVASDGYSAEAETSPDVPAYIGRVAIDPSCFTTTPLDLEACRWLDSQQAIETALAPGAIQATAITVTCPVVSVRHQPINPGAW